MAAMAVELNITPHSGGFGRCHLCGEESLHRAMLSVAGRRKTILLCDECNKQVAGDMATRNRVVEILTRD